MEPEPRKSPIRFYEIDLLRFLAALSVVFYHYCFAGYALGNLDGKRLSPLAFPDFESVTRYGALGVELFFMVSGYVVLLSAQGKTVRQFLLSRVTRLYPAFWAACTVTFVTLRIWGATATELQMSRLIKPGLGQYVYNLTMLQDFFGISNMDGVYWTLTVEIAFYFLISLLIGYKLLQHLDWFLVAWLTMAALPNMHWGHTTFGQLFFPEYAPFFIAGMLYYLFQQPGGRRRLHYALLAGSFLLAEKTIIKGELDTLKVFGTQTDWRPAAAVVAVFFLLFYLISFRKINLSRYTWLARVGGLTYPLYLLHANIGYIIFWRAGHLVNKYLLLGATITLMITAAYLVNTFVEKPFSKPLGIWLSKRLAKLDDSKLQ